MVGISEAMKESYMLLVNTWMTRKKASVLNGKANWNSVGVCIEAKVILRNSGIIAALGHSRELLIVPRIIVMRKIISIK